MNLNGATVLIRQKDAIYVRIPPELQKPIEGGCCCNWCRKHPELTPAWDTLVVPSVKPAKGVDYTWTVHMPDPKPAEEYWRERGQLAE